MIVTIKFKPNQHFIEEVVAHVQHIKNPFGDKVCLELPKQLPEVCKKK